jgi:hypothetical protein
MGYWLRCECGQELPVGEGAAGGVLTCACGRAVQVPSLRELRNQFRVEAETKAVRSLPQPGLLVVGALVFVGLFLVGCVLSFAAGGLAGAGFVIFQIGQVWLLVLIIRECPGQAIFLALVIPFFTWYFAYQRLDIAKWPLICNLSGLLLLVYGGRGGP